MGATRLDNRDWIDGYLAATSPNYDGIVVVIDEPLSRNQNRLYLSLIEQRKQPVVKHIFVEEPTLDSF